jgi:hypothetical protein
MNFEDEPYVRVYTRKTLTHKLLGWEGRTVMRLMIDDFDPAGVFEIRGDAAHCISAVTDLPIEIVRVGLARLIETETWVVTTRAITWPTYEEAQNCVRSDRLRQRASRKARAEKSVTDVTLPVTPKPAPVTDVTSGHEMSPSLPPIPAPSLPSPHPPEREDARARPPVPGLIRVVGAVERTFTMPSQVPPKAYLDEAVMAAVSLEQAKSTWKHYWGAGLPPGGVERLYPWLCDRAKDRANQLARLPKARASPGGSRQPNAGLTGFEGLEKTS